MRSLNRRKPVRARETGSFWLSFSDLMSSLLMIIILVLFYLMYLGILVILMLLFWRMPYLYFRRKIKKCTVQKRKTML